MITIDETEKIIGIAKLFRNENTLSIFRVLNNMKNGRKIWATTDYLNGLIDTKYNWTYKLIERLEKLQIVEKSSIKLTTNSAEIQKRIMANVLPRFTNKNVERKVVKNIYSINDNLINIHFPYLNTDKPKRDDLLKLGDFTFNLISDSMNFVNLMLLLSNNGYIQLISLLNDKSRLEDVFLSRSKIKQYIDNQIIYCRSNIQTETLRKSGLFKIRYTPEVEYASRFDEINIKLVQNELPPVYETIEIGEYVILVS